MPLKSEKRKLLSTLIDDLIELHTTHGDMPVKLVVVEGAVKKGVVKASSDTVRAHVVGTGAAKEIELSNLAF